MCFYIRVCLPNVFVYIYELRGYINFGIFLDPCVECGHSCVDVGQTDAADFTAKRYDADQQIVPNHWTTRVALFIADLI